MRPLLLASLFLALPALGAPPDLEQALRAELSVRHDPPPCDVLGGDAPADEVRDALIALADESEMPPWLPLRAAGCVTARAGDDALALSAARRWLADPATPGLALVVTRVAAELSPETELSLCEGALDRAAVDHRFAIYALPLLGESPHPVIADRAVLLMGTP